MGLPGPAGSAQRQPRLAVRSAGLIGKREENKLRLYLGDVDVPDPMGQDDAAFHECAVLIELGTVLHTGGRIT
ncbi:hypothetical protein [Streptomyces sp. NPDC059258]|uniref:hypothetical protein n=1 Tax=unclassified Streptomyces TaxID=2593676 RepID=UPI0036B2EA26